MFCYRLLQGCEGITLVICQAATRGVRHFNLSRPSLPGSSATARHSHSNPRGPWPLRIVPCIIFGIPVSCRTHTHSIPLTISRCQALRNQKAFIEYRRSHMFQARLATSSILCLPEGPTVYPTTRCL